MGQAASAEDDGEEFPWFQILQWATEDLKTSEIFTYDLKAVRTALEKIWETDESFLAASSELAVDLRLSCDEDSAEEVWLSWAEALLVKSPKLAELRYRMVPRKMSDARFWEKIFAASRKAVLSTI